MFDTTQVKIALVRAAIVLVPSYLVAFLTDKMVYVVPTLAAAGFLAATLKFDQAETTLRVDEDGEADGPDGNSLAAHLQDSLDGGS